MSQGATGNEPGLVARPCSLCVGARRISGGICPQCVGTGGYHHPPLATGRPSPDHEAATARAEVAALRERVEALEGDYSADAEHSIRLLERVAALERDVEALNMGETECDQQRENERLRAELAHAKSAICRLLDNRDARRRIVARLRAALEMFAERGNWVTDGGGELWRGLRDEPWTVAQEALATEQPAAPTTEREDAVFAEGYRMGVHDGVVNTRGCGRPRATQSEVDGAFSRWVAGGRKTHLDEEAPAAPASTAGQPTGHSMPAEHGCPADSANPAG